MTYKEKYNDIILSINYEDKIVVFGIAGPRKFEDIEENELSIRIQEQMIALNNGEDLSYVKL